MSSVKKTAEDKEADRVEQIRAIARQYAPCVHLFIWSLVGKQYPGIHPSEVYRAIATDPELVFDGKTSIVNLSNKPNKPRK